MRRWLCAGVSVIAFGCSSEDLADWNQPGVLSPDGSAKARVVHIEQSGSSQVYISFDRGRCGAGSVSAPGPDPDLTLSWRDSATLEISAPAGLPLDPAPASHELDHRVQCHDRIVQVLVRRH